MIHAQEVDDRAVSELDEVARRADRFRRDRVARAAAKRRASQPWFMNGHGAQILGWNSKRNCPSPVALLRARRTVETGLKISVAQLQQ
jgi:hypothetical protein